MHRAAAALANGLRRCSRLSNAEQVTQVRNYAAKEVEQLADPVKVTMGPKVPPATESSPSIGSSSNSETISVTFVDKHGDEKSVKVPLGMSMLEAAHQNDIELEGACEGSLACSTCHVIVMDEKYYNKLPEPTDEENDMLDLAFGLTETSRLGCQVVAKPELDGVRLAIPSATRNFAVDGYVPKPH